MTAYLALNLVVLAGLLPGLIRFRHRLSGRWLLIVLILFVMTAVFDNLIILAGIVTYDPSKLLGLYIGVAPIEDFFYPLVAALVIPVFWNERVER